MGEHLLSLTIRIRGQPFHQAIRILQIVSREKDITIGKVATELSLSHNTASEHIKRLIQKGFIVKERNKKMKEW